VQVQQPEEMQKFEQAQAQEPELVQVQHSAQTQPTEQPDQTQQSAQAQHSDLAQESEKSIHSSTFAATHAGIVSEPSKCETQATPASEPAQEVIKPCVDAILPAGKKVVAEKRKSSRTSHPTTHFVPQDFLEGAPFKKARRSQLSTERFDVEALLKIEGHGVHKRVHVLWKGYADPTWEPYQAIKQQLPALLMQLESHQKQC
jgi:hypothetical protein